MDIVQGDGCHGNRRRGTTTSPREVRACSIQEVSCSFQYWLNSIFEWLPKQVPVNACTQLVALRCDSTETCVILTSETEVLRMYQPLNVE